MNNFCIDSVPWEFEGGRFCSFLGTALLIGGLAGGAASIASAVIGGNAAQSAASTEANAANNASAVQQAEAQTAQQDLAPWQGTGTVALSQLSSMLGLPSTAGGTYNPNAPLAASFNPTQAQLAATPGYQFQMNQGTGAVLNAASALGGVNSGNTLKALTQYGQGLASTNYQQALNNYMAQQQQQYGFLNGLSQQGYGAAAAAGGVSTNLGSQIGSNLIGAGNALGAGQVGSANALAGGINGVAGAVNGVGQNYLTYNLLQSILGGGGGGFNTPTGNGSNDQLYYT